MWWSLLTPSCMFMWCTPSCPGCARRPKTRGRDALCLPARSIQKRSPLYKSTTASLPTKEFTQTKTKSCIRRCILPGFAGSVPSSASAVRPGISTRAICAICAICAKSPASLRRSCLAVLPSSHTPSSFQARPQRTPEHPSSHHPARHHSQSSSARVVPCGVASVGCDLCFSCLCTGMTAIKHGRLRVSGSPFLVWMPRVSGPKVLG